MSTPLPTENPHAQLERQPAVRLLLLLTDGVTGVAVAGILAVVLAQVAGRLLDAPFPWTEELTRACFIWMVFAGVAAGMRHADAARVTVLLKAFPRFVRNQALAIYVATSLAFFLLTIWTGWYMVRQQVLMNERIATLGWPVWLVGIIVPASAVLSIGGLLLSIRTHKAILAATEDNF